MNRDALIDVVHECAQADDVQQIGYNCHDAYLNKFAVLADEHGKAAYQSHRGGGQDEREDQDVVGGDGHVYFLLGNVLLKILLDRGPVEGDEQRRDEEYGGEHHLHDPDRYHEVTHRNVYAERGGKTSMYKLVFV